MCVSQIVGRSFDSRNVSGRCADWLSTLIRQPVRLCPIRVVGRVPLEPAEDVEPHAVVSRGTQKDVRNYYMREFHV